MLVCSVVSNAFWLVGISTEKFVVCSCMQCKGGLKNSAVQNSNSMVDSLSKYKINVFSYYMLQNRKMTL